VTQQQAKHTTPRSIAEHLSPSFSAREENSLAAIAINSVSRPDRDHDPRRRRGQNWK
jgi:hypothetical protein